jgi:olfactory receptor
MGTIRLQSQSSSSWDSGKAEQEEVLFGLFLGMYLVTVTGNFLINLAIGCDPHLHIPMYFFLAYLFSADICFSAYSSG